MDTLLYVGQIIVGATVLIAALALSGRLPARLLPSPVTMYAKFEYAEFEDAEFEDAETKSPRRGCRFGALFAGAAIVFGVSGLAGFSVLPAPVGVLITGMGLISVLLATETTPMIYRVTADGTTPLPVPRAGAETAGEVVALPSPRPSNRQVA